ncbi:MAG: GNAT family N-acetyltransferase [Chloroflexi bacterium]|nr:GNAT family N-acetyltransferase [Chloroflexota bacterium]
MTDWFTQYEGGPPPLVLVGELVALGPAHRGLMPLLWKWENDLELSLLTGDPARPLTPEGVESVYERFSKAGPDHTGFAVYERATLRPIGTAGLVHINAAHRTAELGIGIGEHDCWGNGYGTEATRLLLDYAFTMLGLNNVMLRVFSYNERAIRAYLRAGFQEIGRRREAQRVGDRAYDVIFMDCLAADFDPLVRRERPLPDAEPEPALHDHLPETDPGIEDDLGL